MSCPKIHGKTSTKASDVIEKIGIETLINEYDDLAYDQYLENLYDTEYMVSVLERHKISLRGERLYSMSNLDGSVEEEQQYKRHHFLPTTASSAAYNEAIHLTCWATIATGKKKQNIYIKNDAGKKQPLEVPGTFENFPADIRYCVFTNPERVEIKDFRKANNALKDKVKKLDNIEGVKVQYAKNEYTILDNNGHITLHVHANVIYTLDRKCIRGFRETVKAIVTPDENWHDSGVVAKDDLPKVMKYVNKAQAKTDKKKEDEEENIIDVNEESNSNDDDINTNIIAANKDIEENNYLQDSNEYILDGELITEIELAKRNEKAFVELYKQTSRVSFGGSKNDYREFRSFLKEWSVKVVAHKNRLKGGMKELKFRQVSSLTIEDYAKKQEKKLKQYEKKKLYKKIQEDREKTIERQVMVNGYYKALSIEGMEEKYKDRFKSIRNAKERKVQKVNREAKNDGGMSPYYEAKIKGIRDFYNKRLDVLRNELEGHVKNIEDKWEKETEKTISEFKEAWRKQDIRDGYIREKKEKQKKQENVFAYSTGPVKNREKGAWDRKMKILGFNADKFYGKERVETEREAKRIAEMRDSFEFYNNAAVHNGWDNETQRNTLTVKFMSGRYLEALWSTYLDVERGVYRIEHFREDFYKWVEKKYDPLDYAEQEMPIIQDENIVNFIDEMCENYDYGVRKALSIGFIHYQLSNFLYISATPAVNCDKNKSITLSDFMNKRVENLLPDEGERVGYKRPPNFNEYVYYYWKNNPDLQIDLKY